MTRSGQLLCFDLLEITVHSRVFCFDLLILYFRAILLIMHSVKPGFGMDSNSLKHVLGIVKNIILTLLFLILLVECVSPDREGSNMPEGGPSLPKSGFLRKDPRSFSQEIFMKRLTFNLITKVVSNFILFFLLEMIQSFLIMFMAQMDVSRL